jgi:flagellar hook assembly protein FlgD
VSDTRLTIYTNSFSLIRHIEAPASPVLGGYYMDWDGTDDHGKTVSSGVYLYNIEVDGEKRAGKFVVVRKQ